ncbi:MAG: butyrate kinase [Spirochaeta sp.]|nr:butyrate kinase [Spirochaeta sp.]
MYNILVINPGSTSTKIALYQTGADSALTEQLIENITYKPDQLDKLKSPITQLPLRIRTVKDFLKRNQVTRLDAVAGRGGLVRPIPAGSYRITKKMIDDLSSGSYGSHASNLGALIAHKIASAFGCSSLIADPVGVDEFDPLSRYTGLPGMERRCQSHALNIRTTARKAAKNLNTTLEKANFVVAHLGGGISIVPLYRGRIIDVNNAYDGGPFSPQRTGSLPTTQLVELAFSGKYKSAEELNYTLTRKSGLLAYLGTDDGREIRKRIEQGDQQAAEVYQAMAFQIAKEIGAMASVLKGRVKAIIITGGMARPPLTDWISERTDWIAPLYLFPGEHEMTALAEAALRFLLGQEKLRDY